MKKEIALVTGSESTRISLYQQLREYIPEEIEIRSYSTEEKIFGKIDAELILISGQSLEARLREAGLVEEHSKLLVAKRALNYDCVDLIVSIPPGTDVLLVNDSATSVSETIRSLRMLGLDHLNYIPYYPKKEGMLEKVKIAISVGEADKVPSFVETVYEIGTRIIALQTLVELMNHLGISTDVIGIFTDKYMNKIINVAKRFAVLNGQVNRLNNHLSSVIDAINDGLAVFGAEDGTISVFNENLKRIFNIRGQDLMGKNITSVIGSPAVVEFLKSAGAEKEQVLNIFGKDILASKFPAEGGNVVAIFKDAEEARLDNQKIKRNLIEKGFFGKYTFDDILGEASEMRDLKQRLKRLARTDLTVLMEGESGTGKELFASAIHNESKRRDMPFLAVNFSSIHDSLLESELFGYEEGSFTGASRGGKEGLFELADGGTIFLDEVGDISEKMQARLLRVLQEKEVMRIGGKEIKRVDIRVIAATNKNLYDMVRKGLFRQDLYYRLRIGFVRIPPLRQRKTDLPMLVHYFLKAEGGGEVSISPEAMELLMNHEWYGNVRELRNTVIYMLALADGGRLTERDVPEWGFFRETEPESFEYRPAVGAEAEVFRLNSESLEILRLIGDGTVAGRIMGRAILLEKLREEPRLAELTEYRLRKRLSELERAGLITMGRGRVGILLTKYGEKTCESIK